MHEVEIPVYSHGAVVDYARIDLEDWPRVSGRRWLRGGDGYARWSRNVGGKIETILMHRLIMGLVKGDGLLTDHINRNKLDNRRANLRLASPRLNVHNAHRGGFGSSRYRGVCWDKQPGKWRADFKRHHIGLFSDEFEAALAAQAWRDQHAPDVPRDPALGKAS